MSKIVNHAETPQSNESKLIQFSMGLFGMKKAMEKKIMNNRYSKEPADIPSSIFTKFIVETGNIDGRKVWTISPKSKANNAIMLFFHGGAYYANISPMHWRLIEQLIINTNTAFVVPDYPLAPESSCMDTYKFTDKVYAKIIADYPSNPIMLMGDSSGGGLALGFAQKIRNENMKQPEKIILFSPWLDVSMTNPDILKNDKHDKILHINGLKIAGEKYAGELGVTDFRVSPIYGDFDNLGKISIFIGTNDILLADARRLREILDKQHLDFDYFEYPKMFHDWVLVPNLKETKEVMKWLTTQLLYSDSTQLP